MQTRASPCARCWRSLTGWMHATETVVDITAAGIIPAALEMMDRTHHRSGRARRAGRFSARCRGGAARRSRRSPANKPSNPMNLVSAICQRNGAREVRVAKDDNGAATPMERPQRRLRRDGYLGAELLRPGRRRAAQQAAGNHAAHRRNQQSNINLRIANVFHAGDGNLASQHPFRHAHARGTGPRHRSRRGDARAPASSSAAASPANTASAWRKKAYIGLLFNEDGSRTRWRGFARPSIPTDASIQQNCSQHPSVAGRCAGNQPIFRRGCGFRNTVSVESRV